MSQVDSLPLETRPNMRVANRNFAIFFLIMCLAGLSFYAYVLHIGKQKARAACLRVAQITEEVQSGAYALKSGDAVEVLERILWDHERRSDGQLIDGRLKIEFKIQER